MPTEFIIYTGCPGAGSGIRIALPHEKCSHARHALTKGSHRKVAFFIRRIVTSPHAR